ncbi:MAG TPA: DUF2950 domain-containing protein [Candidatus Saccharimonadales bacterium]|nr:DUF2950 domain-containing protein [Candidatus Saccharimonadales bacterium]
MRGTTTMGGMTMRGNKRMIAVGVSLLFLAVPMRAADQKTFATAAEAAQALYKASADENQDEIMAVLGDDGKELVYSGDPVQDKRGMAGFVKAYKTKHALVKQDDKTQILQVGANDWPLPIPIVNDGGKWRFDTVAGKEELLYRRIGHNELGAISACRGFIDAEKDYAAVGHDGLPAGLYADKLMSTPGKQDGLYWETKEDEPASPAGPFLAEAGGKGYAPEGLGGKSEPYHGYLYRILKAQGASARGGAKSYVVDGQLKDGVALVAYPAEYRVSGVMTFIINQRGVVYQKDLGEQTSEVAGSMTEYSPDTTWAKVTD